MKVISDEDNIVQTEIKGLEFIRELYRNLYLFLRTAQGYPLERLLPIPSKLAESIHKAIFEMKEHWEFRYNACLLTPPDSIDEPESSELTLIIHKTLNRKTFLDRYRTWADDIYIRLMEFEGYLKPYKNTLFIPYGILRVIRRKILAYLKYRQTFG